MAKRDTTMWLWLGLGAAALYFMNQPKAGASTGPSAGPYTSSEPIEYWIDPQANKLWYEFGGVKTAPQPGMRPASQYEVSSYWPPANHPEFGTFSSGPSASSGYF